MAVKREVNYQPHQRELEDDILEDLDPVRYKKWNEPFQIDEEISFFLWGLSNKRLFNN